MRRFLLSFFFVGALSAVFSFTAFAENCYTDFLGTSQTTYSNIVTYNVSASAGDLWFFDVSVNSLGDQIYNGNRANVTSSISNRSFDFTYAVTAVGCNYGAATCTVEGKRVWVFFDRAVSSGSVTLTYEVTVTYSWTSGVAASGSNIDLSHCIATRNFNFSNSSFTQTASGLATSESNSQKLDTILEQLGDSSVIAPDFLGSDAIVYFRKDYFSNLSANSGSAYYNSRGMAVATLSGSNQLTFADSTQTIALSPGDYYIYVAAVGRYAQYGGTVSFFGYDSSAFDVVDRVNKQLYTDGSCMSVIRIRVKEPIMTTDITFTFSWSMSGITVYGGIVAVDDDVIFDDALNSEQDGLSDQVDDAGHQQSQQESDMWQNINSYKSDISFGLDGWNEATNGLSYVTGIFMTVWNNSPTQPIVLSLMLGIAMLSIGRGVMAAVRVQRNRRNE